MGCICPKPRMKTRERKGRRNINAFYSCDEVQAMVVEAGNGQHHAVSLISTSYGLFHYLHSSTGETFSSSSVVDTLRKIDKFELPDHSKQSYTELGEINLKLLRREEDFSSFSEPVSEATAAAEPELIDILLIMKGLQEEEEEEEPIKPNSRRPEMADKRHSGSSFRTVKEVDCLGKTVMTRRRKESSSEIEDLRSRISVPSLSSDTEDVLQEACCKLEINTKPVDSSCRRPLSWPNIDDIPTKEAMTSMYSCSTLLFEPDLVEVDERALEISMDDDWLLSGSCLQSLFAISGSKEERDGDEDEDEDPKPKPEPKPMLSQPLQEEGVVLYTTSLQGIRKTFEDSNNLRTLVRSLGVLVHEKDLSLHPPFRKELASFLGGGAPISLPQLFIKGKHIGGAKEAARLYEQGKLAELVAGLPLGRSETPLCDGCGGLQFIPCLECSGSCKILDEESNRVVRCPDCNENGLIQCPICTFMPTH